MKTDHQALLADVAEHTNPDYSKYSCEELDHEILDARNEIDKSHSRLERELKQRLLPALKELRTRYKRPGARTDLGKLGAPTWSEYLASRGLKPDTVRKWFLRSDAAKKAERLLTSSAPTSGTCPAGSKGQVGTTSHHVVQKSANEVVPVSKQKSTDASQANGCSPCFGETTPETASGGARVRLYEVEVNTSSEGLPELVNVYLLDCDEENAKRRAEEMVAYHATVTFDYITAAYVREVDHVLVGDNVDSRGHQSPVPALPKRPPVSSRQDFDKAMAEAGLAGFMAKLEAWR